MASAAVALPWGRQGDSALHQGNQYFTLAGPKLRHKPREPVRPARAAGRTAVCMGVGGTGVASVALHVGCGVVSGGRGEAQTGLTAAAAQRAPARVRSAVTGVCRVETVHRGVDRWAGRVGPPTPCPDPPSSIFSSIPSSLTAVQH